MHISDTCLSGGRCRAAIHGCLTCGGSHQACTAWHAVLTCLAVSTVRGPTRVPVQPGDKKPTLEKGLEWADASVNARSTSMRLSAPTMLPPQPSGLRPKA